MEEFTKKFEESLWKMPRADNACAIISEEHYSVLVREVIEAKAAPKKTSKQYRRLKKYDILLMGAKRN